MDEIVNSYKTGDVFNCSRNSLIGRIIRKVTKSHISHTAIFIWIWGEPYIIDSQRDGTRVRHFNEWKNKYNYKYTVLRSPTLIVEDDMAKKMMGGINVPYGFMDLVRQLIYIKTNLWIGVRNEDKFRVCSEFVGWVYNAPAYFKISPKELMTWMESQKYIEILNNF